MSKKKRWVIIMVSFVLVAIAAFAIYWNATEFDRYRENEMNFFLEELEDYRRGDTFSMSVYINDDLMTDTQFQDFLAEQIQEMYNNDEMNLLRSFLFSLEYDKCYSESILETVTNCFDTSNSVEKALEMKHALDSLEYYDSQLTLTRDSQIITSYISKNGTDPISYTRGEGYYAEYKDTSSRHTVGIPGSPLYDAETVTYFGDFKHVHKYGCDLNSYYEEESYSHNSYYFRDRYIDFPPEDGECVWSGNYLFCFSDNGELIGFEEIEG